MLCVVNLNAKMKPINFNIVSVGNLTQTVADIPFITKSAICSGAASTILLHTHPSGDPTPSREDVELTKRVVEAGKLIGISCVDHVIVGQVAIRPQAGRMWNSQSVLWKPGN